MCQRWVSTNTASCWSRRQALAMDRLLVKTGWNSAAGKWCGFRRLLKAKHSLLHVGRELSAIGRNAAATPIARWQKRSAYRASLGSVFVPWVVGRTPSFRAFLRFNVVSKDTLPKAQSFPLRALLFDELTSVSRIAADINVRTRNVVHSDRATTPRSSHRER